MATTSTTRRGSAGGGGEKSRLRGAHGSGEERRSLRQRTPVRRAANVRCMNSASVRLLLQCRGRCLRETVRERERKFRIQANCRDYVHRTLFSLSLLLQVAVLVHSFISSLSLCVCVTFTEFRRPPRRTHSHRGIRAGEKEQEDPSVCVFLNSIIHIRRHRASLLYHALAPSH